jgi:hypothetical protein
MAEQIPGLPSPTNPKPGPSAEEIRGRLNSINNYLNTYRPGILSGITDAQQDQAAIIARAKSPSIVGTSSVPKVQNTISGNTITGPNPGLKPFNLPDINYVQSLIEKSKIDAASTVDPYKFARPTAFDASNAGYNFDRYYSHGKFKDLGFSIYRDNEREYNANSTWADDFGRMMGKWGSLAWQGGSGLFKNWGEFGQAGMARDAAQMEHDLSVAMSSKPGAGAWVTNFLANTAYTAGIIGEIAIEEFVLKSASRLTGGGTSSIEAMRLGSNLKRLGNSMKIMTQTLNKADKAKTFWTAARGAGWSGAKALLPFQDLGQLGKQVLKPNSAFNRLDDFAKMQKSFGAFYRGMREINAVTAESRLEAGFAQNKVANDALNEFYKKNGRGPTTEEALAISDKASQAASSAFLYNAGAIYLSNKFVLDTALKGFSPVRRLMSKEGLNSNLFKVVRNYGWKEAGKKPMEVVRKGIFPTAQRVLTKDYLKSIPSKLTGTFSKKGFGRTLGGGLRYFSANLMEGLQESWQEAVQLGVTDYYMNQYLSELYSDPHLAAHNSMGASIAKGIDAQFTAQGLDTFAQGFLMGGVMGGVQQLVVPGLQRVQMKTKDWYSKTNSYEEYQAEEKKRLQAYADAYNDYTENPYKYVNWLEENVALQRDLAETYQTAEETGDRKKAEDSRDDSMFAHITTLLQTDRYDAFIDQLKDLSDLSDADLADAFSASQDNNQQNKKSPRERLDIAIKKAENIKARWEKINNKFENPYNPDYFDKTKNPDAHKREVIGYQAFEIAKRAIAFNEYTFDRTISRLTSLANNAATSSPLGSVAATEFSALYSNEQSFLNYFRALSSEIDALEMGDAQEKKLAKKKTTQLQNLLDLKGLMSEYKNKLTLIEKARPAAENPEAASEESKTALKELKLAATKFAKGITDESGQQYVLNFEEGLKEEIQPDVVVDEFLKEELYDAYSKYAKNIADLNDVFPIQESLENSFGDLIDFVKLDHDAKHMAEYADMIANPMAIYDMTNRIAEALNTVSGKKKELHMQGLENYKRNILDVDDLLQKMLDIGVYFDPEHIEKFRKDGVMPPNFIDAQTGNIINKEDPKYNQVVAIIEQEEKLRGLTFSNKPVKYEKPEEKKPETKTPTQPPPPKKEEDELEETPTYDISTEFSKLPADIQTKLRTAHAQAMLDGATTDIQEWMLEDPDAALIIAGKSPIVKKTKAAETEEETETELVSASNPKSLKGAPPEFKDEFDALTAEGWTLTPDSKAYVSKEGEASRRVSELKEGTIPNTPETKKAQDRGNFLDDIFRAFAEPGADGLSFKDQIINAKKKGETDSQVKFKIGIYLRGVSNAIGSKHKIRFDEGYIDTMSSVLLNLAVRFQDYTWYTSVPTMVGNIMGEKFGGTIDLMLEKNGKYYIIDLKTSAVARRGKGELYSRNDQIQQNAYAELWEQITGKPISRIQILNFITTMTDSDNRNMAAVKLDEYKDAAGEKKILVDLPRKSIAELKGAEPIEAAPVEETYKGITVIDSSSIKAATGEPGAAQYNRAENKILINRDFLKKKFEEKAWTKPRKQRDGSFATALPEDAFLTYDSFEKFVIEHEYQHSLLSYTESGKKTIGEYEDEINRRALEQNAPVAETKQVDWNAVIDRATSAQEVDKIMDQIYTAGNESPELIDRALIKKESFAKPTGPKTVKELKDELVARLKAGETITGVVSKKGGSVSAFEFMEEGKPVVTFYNTGGETITIEDMNKPVTLRLEEKVVTADGREFSNVVKVYAGSKFIGNVAETDFRSTRLTENMVTATTPGDLMNNFSSYIGNPSIRDKFTYKAKDGTEQIYTFEQVVELAKRTLSNMNISQEEKTQYLNKIDKLVEQEAGISEKQVSQEEKKLAQDAIDDAADKSVDVDGKDVNDAIDQSQEDIDDEFDNSLDCK